MVQPPFNQEQLLSRYGIKTPAQKRRELEEKLREIERLNAMAAARSLSGAQQGVQPIQLSPNLKPELSPQATPFNEPNERHSFFGRLQSSAETGAGFVANAVLSQIPGEQGALEKNLNEAYEDLNNELGAPTNPWQVIRRGAMANAEAWRRTDMPSFKLDVTPGFGPLNLPGERTLDKVDIGVKGAAEIVSDPANLIPLGLAAKGVTKAGAKGLNAAGLAVVSEAVASVKDGAVEAVQSFKNIVKPRADLPIPEGSAQAKEAAKERLMEQGINLDDGSIRVFRGISKKGDPLKPGSGIVGKTLDEADLVAGPGVYVSRSPHVAESFGKNGTVKEYRMLLPEDDLTEMPTGVLYLSQPVNIFADTQPRLFNNLDQTFDGLWFNGVSRWEGADVGEWFFDVQAMYSETSIRMLREKLVNGKITQKQFDVARKKEVARGQKEFNEDLKRAGVKVIDNSTADTAKELIVLDDFILQLVDDARRVSDVPEVHIRPRFQETAEELVEQANTRIPEFVKSFRDSRFMQALPPVRWAFTKINPIAFTPTASDSLARRQAVALYAHQRQQSEAGNYVMHSLAQLTNIKGFSGQKQGLLKASGYNGVFEVQSGTGDITNLRKARGKEYYKISDEEILKDSRNEFKLNQYAVFENAFNPEYGLDFSKKFDGKLITELPEEKVAELIVSGKVNGEFVDQAYAIKAVGDWVKDATLMMQKRGIDIKEVYEGDSPLQYIFRQAVEKQGKPIPSKGKASGSVQDFAKDRTYLGEKILDSLDNNVVYRDNFLVGATDFMDSVYTAIRDADLRNSLTSTGVKLREELLEAPSARVKAATENLKESLKVKRYLTELKQKSLTKPQLAIIDRVGANHGFDSATLRAEEIISQQRKALANTADVAASYAKEAREMASLVKKLSSRNLDAITWLATDVSFKDKFPELYKAVSQLFWYDSNIEKFRPRTTVLKDLPVDVRTGTKQRAVTETTEFLGERKTSAALNTPIVNYRQTVNGLHRELDRIKQVGAKGRKNWLPENELVIQVPVTGYKYVIKPVKKANGKPSNTWNVYRAGDRKNAINRIPLTHGDELPSFKNNFKPEGLTDEIAPVIAADAQARAGYLKGYPKYIETAGPAQKTQRRNMRVLSKRGDPTAKKVYEKNRKKLSDAIQRDAENISKSAARASDEVKKFISGGKFTFERGQKRWLDNNYPHIANELEAAAALNPGKAKRDAIAKAQRTIAQVIKEQEDLEKNLKDDLRKAKSDLVGRVDVTEKSFQKRFYGTHLETGKLNPDTGLHEIKVLKGADYRNLVKDGGKSLVLKEVSQKHLPFLKGVFFREEDVKRIEKALLLPEATDTKSIVESFFLRAVPAAGDLARVLKAGFDFGAPFLQGIPLLARRPDVWAKATARHYKVFRSGRGFHQAYLQNNVDVIREMAVLNIPLGAGATDYFDALNAGGAVDQIGGFLSKNLGLDAAEKSSNKAASQLGSSAKFAGRKIRATGKRFEESFEAFNDYARIEMFKALRNTAAKRGGEGMDDLAAFIRNMTGALDTAALGASGRQQAFERGWLFFSPRYTRASLALMADAFQGGLRGQQARQTFVQMAGGGAVAYMAFAEALGQPIKLDPRPKSEGGNGAEFMTVKIAGQNVGIGSFWTSMIRMIASTATTAVDDPSLLVQPNTRDNPIARWIRSRSAPSTGFSLDFANGANFLGESIEGFGGWATHIGRQTLPFAVENAIFEDGPIFGRLAVGLPAEMLGGRTFPVSAIEYRNVERERAAQATYKKSWEELNGLQRRTLENDPEGELGELTEIVRREATRLQPADPGSAEAAIANYFDSKQAAEETWRKKIREGVHLFDDGNKIDTVAFKERYLEPANARRRTEIGIATEDPSYREVEKYFAELSKDSPLNPEDEAFGEYMRTVVAADFSDPVIGFDFRLQDEAKREFTAKYGEETFQYVQERFRAARESYDFQFPALIDELYIGRDRFEYYWRDTEEEVLNRVDNSEYVRGMYEKYIRATDTTRSIMKENIPELDAYLRILEKTRRLLRESNAELDIFLYRWGFANTLAHEANKVVHNSDPEFFRHHPATSFPYPVEEN